ncbi:unnamed protein product [Malus baccata var. baccata]
MFLVQEMPTGCTFYIRFFFLHYFEFDESNFLYQALIFSSFLHLFELKALIKNGMQINGALIIGVKPLDPMQHHALNERVNNQGFMTFPPQPSMKHAEMNASRALPRPYYLQNDNSSGQKSGGAIASRAKSLVSKVMDLMLGM